MSIYEKIIKKEAKIAVIGLGYVGLPIALAFAKKVKVIDREMELSVISPANVYATRPFAWNNSLRILSRGSLRACRP